MSDDPTPDAPDTPGQPAAPQVPPQSDPKPDTDAAKLQQALGRERELRKAAEKQARENAAYRARAEELEAATATDMEKAVKSAREEGRREARDAANAKLTAAEARALAAAAKFRDPHDAARFLDLTDVAVTDSGDVDTDLIAARLARLAQDKPYLVATDTPPAEPPAPRTPKPDPSQGSGKQTQQTGADRGLAEAERRFGKRPTT